jgi:hypothetical protein
VHSVCCSTVLTCCPFVPSHSQLRFIILANRPIEINDWTDEEMHLKLSSNPVSPRSRDA